MRNKSYVILFFSALVFISSCATQKKRSELSWLAKRYHNMTAKYNGYYNADVIMDETFASLNEGHEDNYNRILPVYPYSDMDSPETVKLELDRAIEKVTKVSRLHESSKWVDDCYVLMGKAQYLQGNYEAAEETFEYFIKNFNPKDPKSRLYSEKEPSNKAKAKLRQKKAQEARKKRLDERKQKEKEREQEIKDRKKAEKQNKKDRDQKKKDRDSKKSEKDTDKSEEDAREQKIKEREEAVKNSKKKEKEKELSAEERRKQRIKERNDAIKNRKKESRKKPKKQTREEREAAKKAAEEKKIAERKAAEEKREAEKLARQKKREEEKLAEEKVKQAKKEAEQKEKERKEEEALKKKEEKQKEESKKTETKQSESDLKDRAKGGFLKHQPAYYEGMLWLAKTYIERENYVQAKYYINRIEEEEDKGVPPHVLNEVPVVRSDLFIRQKSYEGAVAPLRQSIENTKDRGLKARYAFILAQLHQRSGNTQDAAEAFAQVEKFSRDYDMNLNAKLNQVKNEWASGGAGYDPTIRKLNRMEKDKKNIGYEGAIYFTRAEIKQANGNESGAVEDFQKALKSSVSNINTIESYYRLATLYYGLEDYIRAKSYYDSTATTMQKRDERYNDVRRKSTNLKEIVKNIFIIEKQDSLLKLGEMSKEEMQQYALDIVEEREREAEEANRVSNIAPPPATTAGGTSKFFAYNNRSVQRGKNSFGQKWGDRLLEDDWRRSNKQSSGVVESEEVQTLEELDSDRKKEVDKILREIPKNKRDKEKAVGRLEKAYFDLGIGYRNYIKNYKRSSESLKIYVSQFPEGKNLVDAYYYLYLNAKDLGLSSDEQSYFNIITSEYPDSDYAKVLKDPSFANKLLTEERKISKAYDEAFYLFENAEFHQAYDMIKQAKTDFGNDHDMMSKYDLLEAMCLGNIDGKDSYVSALRKVVIKHNNTPEQTRAREMLRFLKGDSEAFEGEITSEDIQEFKQEDDKLHYIIVALFEADGNLVNQAKNSINKYNQANHKDKRIRSTSIYLNQQKKTHLILLRRFENKKVSMDYFGQITKDADEFLDPGVFQYDLFSVNQKNYREIVKQKSTRSYRLFFDTYYLDGEK